MENNNSQYAKRGQIAKDFYVVVQLPNGLITKKDFDGFSKDEIIQWCEERGWKYNSKGEKLGGQILKNYEFFVKEWKRVDVGQLPSKKYAKGGTIGHRTNGEINATYLDSFSEIGQERILNNIANHYGIHLYEANDEVRSDEAEMLYEYIADDDALKMMIYSDLKEGGYAKGGEVGQKDSFGYTEEDYNKPIGKTYYTLEDFIDDRNARLGIDGDGETKYFFFDDLEEAREQHRQSELRDIVKIEYVIQFDTDEAPYAYESGYINWKGEKVPKMRKGKGVQQYDKWTNTYFAEGGEVDEREIRFQKENDLLQSVDKDYVIVMHNKKTKKNEILTSPDTFQTQWYRYTSLKNKGQLVGFEKIKIVQLQDLDFTYEYDGDLFAKGGEVDKKKYKFEITEYKDKNAVINDEPTLSDYEGTKEKVVDFEYQRMQRGYCVYFNITIVADSNNEGWFFESEDLYDLTDKIENSDDDDYEDNDYENDVMKIYGYAKGGEIERGSAHMYIDMSNGNYKVYHGNDVKLRANAHPLHTFTNASEGTYDKIWEILQNNGYAKGDDVERGSAHMYIDMSNGNYKVYHGNDVKLRANAHPLHTFTNASEGTYDKIWEILRGKQFAKGGEVMSNEMYAKLHKITDWKIIKKQEHPLRKNVSVTLSQSDNYYRIAPFLEGKIVYGTSVYFTNKEDAEKEYNQIIKNYEIKEGDVVMWKGNEYIYEGLVRRFKHSYVAGMDEKFHSLTPLKIGVDEVMLEDLREVTKISSFAKGGKVAQKVFVAEEDGILGIVSGSDAYSIEISKGDTFATHGEQDDSNWWYVKKVDAKPTTMSEDNTFDDTKSKSRVKVNWDELLLTFPKGDKMMYAQMTESKPKASPKRRIKRKG